MNAPRPVSLTLIQLTCLLRQSRIQRDRLWQDYLKLEEQVRAGHDGVNVQAAQALLAEVDILDTAIAELWRAMP